MLASLLAATLVNSHVNNVLVKIAPDLSQSLFQFITALDSQLVWLLGGQKSSRIKSGFFLHSR